MEQGKSAFAEHEDNGVTLEVNEHSGEYFAMTSYKRTDVGVLPDSWDVKPLRDLAAISSGGTPSRARADYWNGDIPWITTSQVNFSRIEYAEEFISNDGLQNSAAKLLPAGTLLLALYGQGKTRGKVGILGIQAATNQACAAIEIKRDVSPKFLLHFLTSRYDAIRGMSNGGSQDNLNSDIVKSILVPIPSPAEQALIVTVLSDVDALIASLEKLIAKKRDLKQATMQQLLTGQTRLPGFSGEWTLKTLGDIADIRKGQLITTATLVDGNIPVIAGGRKPAYFHNKSNRLGKTITVSASGASAGYVAFHRSPIFASDCSTISEADDYCIEFLYFSLLLKQEAIYSAQTGGAQPHIQPKDLSTLPVRLPIDLNEQEGVAKVLCDMDDEMAALESRLTKTRALKQGMMQELLTGRTRLV